MPGAMKSTPIILVQLLCLCNTIDAFTFNTFAGAMLGQGITSAPRNSWHRPLTASCSLVDSIKDQSMEQNERVKMNSWSKPMVAACSVVDGTKDRSMEQDERVRTFELNRGKAVDTLMKDYPMIFQAHDIDFSIFSERVNLVDTQGFSIEGIGAYKAFFSVIKKIVSVLFADCKTSVVLMDKYAVDKSKIKLRWKLDFTSRLPQSWSHVASSLGLHLAESEITPEKLRGLQSKDATWRSTSTMTRHLLILEGISEYKLDAKGYVYEHRITITYPATPFSLAPLRQLLPVRSGGQMALGIAGTPHGVCHTTDAAAVAVNVDADWGVLGGGVERTVRVVLDRMTSDGRGGNDGTGFGVRKASQHTEEEDGKALAVSRDNDLCGVGAPAIAFSNPPKFRLDFGGFAFGTSLLGGWFGSSHTGQDNFDSASVRASGGGLVMQAASAKGGQGMSRGGWLESVMKGKKLPKQCQQDYDCNPGGYNFPLVCVDFVIARFCVDPDDFTGGGNKARTWTDQDMAREAIPVRVQDGYLPR